MEYIYMEYIYMEYMVQPLHFHFYSAGPDHDKRLDMKQNNTNGKMAKT